MIKKSYFYFKKCLIILDFPLSAADNLYLNWYKVVHFFAPFHAILTGEKTFLPNKLKTLC